MQINYDSKEIILKIIITGPAGAGVSSTLAFLRHLAGGPPEEVELEAYEHLHLNLGKIGGYAIYPHLYTIPASTPPKIHQSLLEGADAVLFVVDSQTPETSGTQLEELRKKLRELDLLDASIVILANKQDLSNAAPIANIKDDLKLTDELVFGTTASSGEGVSEAWRATLKLLIKKLT